MPDPLFQVLFDETDGWVWAPTGALRDRARRRVRRTRAAAAVAAVAAVGVISGGVAAAQLDRAVAPRPGTSTPAGGQTPSESPAPVPPPVSPSAPAPTGPPAPTPPPASTAALIEDALFLRLGDPGPGYRRLDVTGDWNSGDWTFEFSMSALSCPYRLGTPPDSLARRDQWLSRGTLDDEDWVAQYVARYRPGDAARYLDQVRLRVDACRPDDGSWVKIVAQGFAGQESLLVEFNFAGAGGGLSRHVLVRQGDLLTEVVLRPERSSAATQELARTAALRLCAGTPAC